MPTRPKGALACPGLNSADAAIAAPFKRKAKLRAVPKGGKHHIVTE